MDIETLKLKNELGSKPKQAFSRPETPIEREQRLAREILGNAITGSSIHGIAGIYSVESKILKLILTVFFLVSAGYCGYQLYIVIMNFMSYGVFTTTSFNHEVPAEFPGNCF
jgi:hypothetical protein